MFAYLCALLLLAFTGARVGLSYYYAEASELSNSETDAANAIFYDPANPEAYASRGLLRLRSERFADAVDDFQYAVKLREFDFLLWLRLGHALVKLNDFDAAGEAYFTAMLLAPEYAQPNKYMGLMLLDLERNEKAFRYLSKAAELDELIYPEILQLARKQYPNDPSAIENAVKPSTIEAKKVTARYFIKYNLMTDSVKTFLKGNELSDGDKDGFIRYLIRKENPLTAHEVWLTKKLPASLRSNDDDNRIFDGGFENITESDDSGFGWRINKKLSDSAIAIDNKLSRTGSRSLHVKFAGRVEAGKEIISQMVVLKPNQNYRLTFAVLSPELTSGGLPIVIVNAGKSESRFAQSAPIMRTDNRWVNVTLDFTTNDETTALISLSRASCDTQPCPIFGELSVDDFSLKQRGQP